MTLSIEDAEAIRQMAIRLMDARQSCKWAEARHPGKYELSHQYSAIQILEHNLAQYAQPGQDLEAVVDYAYYILNTPVPLVHHLEVQDLPKARSNGFSQHIKPETRAKAMYRFIRNIQLSTSQLAGTEEGITHHKSGQHWTVLDRGTIMPDSFLNIV